MSKVTGKGFPLSPVTCLLFPAFCLLFSASQFFTAIPSLSASGPEPGMVQGDGWAATYGGGRNEHANSIQQTRDGGYIVAGLTRSFGAGAFDVWVLKLRPDGTIDWQKTYGGADHDEPVKGDSIHQTSDGGYIMVGKTMSFGEGRDDLWDLKHRPDGTVEWQKAYGLGDAWVLKLRPDGTVEWQKTYGGVNVDWAESIQKTGDGGYIMAGWTDSFGSGIGEADAWVLKLKADGTVEWQKTYGGVKNDGAYSILQTTDGGYVVAGWTTSFGAGEGDIWVLKLRPDVTVEWQKTYGGTESEGANCIQQTSDGGYIVAGETKSFGDEWGDAWVLKLRPDGTVEWQKTYGGDIFGRGHCIRQTSDGGYVVTGWIVSLGEEWGNARVLKLASDGTVEWQKTYGEDSLESANSIQETTDGGYIVAGETNFFGAGGGDIWVLKLRPSGAIRPSCHFIRDSRVSVMDTSARVIDTSAAIRDSNASAKDSSATVQDTDVSARFLVK